MWLLKTEPGTYSFSDLEREGRTVWDGVRSPAALAHLRRMREGEAVLVYHTGRERSVVGTARVARAAHSDPGGPAGRGVVVELEAGRRLDRPVPLEEIRGLAVFRGSPLLDQGRLSVVPLTEEQWRAVGERGSRAGPAVSPGALVVLSTVGKAADAERIARALVERGLAACVNVLPAILSFYRWQGRLEREEELLLLAKTTADRFEELRAVLVSLHPYDLPEVVALPVAAGHRPYLDWVAGSLR